MNRSLLLIVATLACSSYALAQDTEPTAPLGVQAQANGDEALQIHWKICFGNNGTSGGPILDVKALAANVAANALQQVIIVKPGIPQPPGGTPPSGYAD